MTEPVRTPPPATGVPELDEALTKVDLTGPVSEHPEQLAAAVDALQQALRDPARR